MQPSTLRNSGANQPPSAGEPIEYKKLEGYINNLSHAATNKNTMLQQLTASIASLTSTNKMLVAKIKSLTANNKYLGGIARSTTTAHPGKGNGKGRWAKLNQS